MSDSSEYKEAKANAKAEKARAKAMRPWFKKKRFIVPIVFGLLIVISVASNGGSSDNSASSGSSEESTSESSDSAGESATKMLGIGDAAQDGVFKFTVKSVKCGIKGYGSADFGVKAQGQYCEFAVSVENTGDKAEYMFADNQKLFSADNKEFSADTSALIYASDSDTWIKEINPGNTLEGLLIFDVPKDIELSHLELHESVFSSGVEVSVK